MSRAHHHGGGGGGGSARGGGAGGAPAGQTKPLFWVNDRNLREEFGDVIPVQKDSALGLVEDAPDFSGPIVGFEVGPNPDSTVNFFIQEQFLLRGSSEELKSRLREMDSGEDMITYDEVEPDNFHHYVQWLYTGRFFIEDQEMPEDWEEEAEEARWTILRRWMQIWITGITLLDVDYCDASIDCLIELVGSWETLSKDLGEFIAHIIYQHSAPENNARKLAVEMTMKRWDKSIYSDMAKNFDVDDELNLAPTEFWKKFSARLANFGENGVDRNAIPLPQKWSDFTCRYHEHWKIVPPQPCYKMKRRW